MASKNQGGHSTVFGTKMFIYKIFLLCLMQTNLMSKKAIRTRVGFEVTSGRWWREGGRPGHLEAVGLKLSHTTSPLFLSMVLSICSLSPLPPHCEV